MDSNYIFQVKSKNIFLGGKGLGSMVRKTVMYLNTILDAQVTEFILSDNCFTCFGRYYHPSSEAQKNCNYRI